jgi:hypothetical protein
VEKRNLPDEEKHAAQGVAALRSGKLDNGRAGVGFTRQAKGLSSDPVSYAQILDG